MQKIVPFLWFDNEAEEAASFYASVFTASSIGNVARYGKEGARISGRPEGSVMTVEFMAIDSWFEHSFTFTPAISFVVNCETQEEIDSLWDGLSEGGAKQQCGWLQDRYGISWQITPAALDEMMQDPSKAEKVMEALLKMGKLDIAELWRAHDQ